MVTGLAAELVIATAQRPVCQVQGDDRLERLRLQVEDARERATAHAVNLQ